MTLEKLANCLINSSTKDLQALSSDELKELREFMQTKTTEINWILKGRAIAKSKHSDNNKI